MATSDFMYSHRAMLLLLAIHKGTRVRIVHILYKSGRETLLKRGFNWISDVIICNLKIKQSRLLYMFRRSIYIFRDK